ncbi:MAG TPA: hypothetical protein VMA34_10140 [Terracidiphilus sp.]|nr:hypothetical protein [Terracidiphilus sp.]
MRTTLDIPDETYRRLKVKAATEGATVREIAVRGIRRELDEPVPRATRKLTDKKQKCKCNKTRDEFYGLPPIGQKQRRPMDGAQFHPPRVGNDGGGLNPFSSHTPRARFKSIMSKFTTSSVFPDVNVWLALSSPDHQHFRAAWSWCTALPRQTALVFCRITQLGLLRLLTAQSVMGKGTLTQAGPGRRTTDGGTKRARNTPRSPEDSIRFSGRSPGLGRHRRKNGRTRI